ncbi:MAG TPA: heme biosynthesis HemY N-terminal domain-containing protein [Casimicrobiaceae bacterium]
MRGLLAFLVLAAAAVTVALIVRINAGYALFVAPPYRVELSLNTFVLLIAAAFFAVYAFVRIVARLSRLPRDVRDHRRKRQLGRARAKEEAAVVALIEGRHGKARQFAEESLSIPGSSPLGSLIAARAALETRDFDAVESALARPEAQLPSLAVSRLMLEAEAAFERGRPVDALTRLAELRKEAGLHTAALRLELRALTAAGRHGEIPPLIDQLVKRKVYDAPQGEVLRASAHAEALAGFSHDASGLRDYWNRLSDAEKLQSNVACAAATSFIALGGDREAAETIARSLERRWDSDLVALYADCSTADPTRQLEIAERWLAEHNNDATLLYALGRLCERAQLWGKAQTYLEASLALDNGWRANLALGEMQAKLGRNDQANAHLAAALKLALAELDKR